MNCTRRKVRDKHMGAEYNMIIVNNLITKLGIIINFNNKKISFGKTLQSR